MENTFEAKRRIFDLFDNARVLFNDYYNGFNHNYTKEDKKVILGLITMIDDDLDNIKESLGLNDVKELLNNDSYLWDTY